MKERKPYEKPAVIFEKELEALAATCEPPRFGVPDTCKAPGSCTPDNYANYS